MSVRYALLALLSEGPTYGMKLREEYEAATGDIWPLNVGQVYTTLARLERDGLIEPDDGGEDEREKAFRITAQGQTELTGWLKTPPGSVSPQRDELVTKVLVALRVPGMKVHDVIQAHRRQIVELMQQWTRFKEEETESDLSFALMVESELIRLGALVSWLDVAETMVRNAPGKSAKGAGPKLRRRVVVRQ
jgi:DNA-binding PadR family transcriptional regulator